MSASTLDHNTADPNPFACDESYSPEAVQLMRALRTQRISHHQQESSPGEILQVLQQLGYQNKSQAQLNPEQQTKRFVMALERQKASRNASFVSCEDVLDVIHSLGYEQSQSSAAEMLERGLPIDRRRREEDGRDSKTERRDDPTPGPQETLDLTEEEHAFLDELKGLREKHGRDFASSQELLSILWTLNYRPRQNDGRFAESLNDEQKFALQVAFTRAIEERLSCDSEDEFLTVRSVLSVVAELGFHRVQSA